jgi:hypothetical protein
LVSYGLVFPSYYATNSRLTLTIDNPNKAKQKSLASCANEPCIPVDPQKVYGDHDPGFKRQTRLVGYIAFQCLACGVLMLFNP